MSITYRYTKADDTHYAASLSPDTSNGSRRLTWQNVPGQNSLLVEAAYGVDTAQYADAIVGLLNSVCTQHLPDGFFHKLSDDFSVRYVSAEEKARERGCTFASEARSYTVFACTVHQGGSLCDLYILSGRRGSMSSPSCDIPMRVKVVTEAVVSKKGWFFMQKEVPSEFFRLRFPEKCSENYNDGDLEYCVGEWNIPITRRMFEAAEVYVRTAERPRIISRNPGVLLV